ncbi:MAG: rhodanese-like domain-containing protein [Proteobacteria bacterium]|nr:rhodanese-like domain-containing protein [Pseudomonadota bacterium]MDA1070014.1 rhodanese-like domain-containing protein [Pseudomonadota bacterium]
MNDAGYAGDVMPAEAWKRLQDDPRAVLVDVRTDAEWRFVGIPDLAPIGKQVRLVEWQTFPDGHPNAGFSGEVAGLLEKDQPVYFLCRSGARSRAAAIALTAMGFGPCYNVAQGFEGDKDGQSHRGSVGGWKHAGLPWRQD